MKTVVKFIPRVVEGKNLKAGLYPLVTRTLGKIGLIEEGWKSNGVQPQQEEFWSVDVSRETKIGLNRGCFILRPLDKVAPEAIRKLIPGLYFETMPNQGTLIVTPKTALDEPWIMPLMLKHELMTKVGLYSIIVNLGGSLWYCPTVTSSFCKDKADGVPVATASGGLVECDNDKANETETTDSVAAETGSKDG